MLDEMVLTTLEEIKVFSDPYRIQILNRFEALGRPATVKEIADLMGHVPAKVHYHVKMMEKVNILKLDHTKEINGIIAKYYVPTALKYTIKNEEVGTAVSSAVKQQKIRMIENIFDSSKKTFIDEMTSTERKEPSKDMGTLSMSDVYMTKDEFAELRNLIEDFCDKHKKPEGISSRARYSLLFSVIKTDKN